MKIIKVASSQGSLGKNIETEEAPNVIVKNMSKKVYFEDVKIAQSNLEETNKNILKREVAFQNILVKRVDLKYS